MKKLSLLRTLTLSLMLMMFGMVNAQNVAKIGSTEHATLSDAFGAATDGCTITLLKDATLAGATSLGSKTVTIEAESKSIHLNIGNALTQMQSANVTFENLTVDYKSNTNYHGFQTSSLTFKNCNINGEPWTYANNFTCVNCTFTQVRAESGNRYALYVYGSKKVVLTNCTFNVDGKAVKISKDGDSTPVIVIADGCSFNSTIVNKNVFMYDTRYSQISVVANNCTFHENFLSEGCEFGAKICADEYVETSANAGYGVVGENIALDENNKVVGGTLTEVVGDVEEEGGLLAKTAKLTDNGNGSYSVNYTRDVTSGHYGTICLPYASSSFENMQVYEVASKNQSHDLFLNPVSVMEAGKPYIFYATGNTITVNFTAGTPVEEPVDAVGLVGTFKDIKAPQGKYVLAKWNNGYEDVDGIFYVDNSNVNVREYRAYIDLTYVPDWVPTEESATAVRLGIVVRPTDPMVTGVEEATAANASKALVNGKLVIKKGAHSFNANGAMLK